MGLHIKRNSEGLISTYKARFVAGLDYEETFSPDVNFLLICLFIVLFICILGWAHSLLDIKSPDYLYGDIDHKI